MIFLHIVTKGWSNISQLMVQLLPLILGHEKRFQYPDHGAPIAPSPIKFFKYMTLMKLISIFFLVPHNLMFLLN